MRLRPRVQRADLPDDSPLASRRRLAAKAHERRIEMTARITRITREREQDRSVPHLNQRDPLRMRPGIPGASAHGKGTRQAMHGQHAGLKRRPAGHRLPGEQKCSDIYPGVFPILMNNLGA
jgi:hypothetical protein